MVGCDDVCTCCILLLIDEDKELLLLDGTMYCCCWFIDCKEECDEEEVECPREMLEWCKE